MQSINKQLFLNMAVDSPDSKHYDVPLTGLSALWIVEDLSQLVPVCTLIYEETYSEFSELFPLLGNETFTVGVGLNKDNYRFFKFKYSSYQSRTFGAMLSRNKEIMTNWIDIDFTKMRQYPQVLHYSQTAISDVVKSASAGVSIDIESTKGSCDYFLNNMVLGEALKDLANRAYNAEGSTFMFYKNNDKFKFQSRNTVMRQKTKSSFSYGYDMTHFMLFGNDRSLFTNPVSNVIGYSFEKGEIFETNKTAKDVKAKKASFGKSMPFGDGTDIDSRFSYDGTRHLHEIEGKATSATEAYMDSAVRIVFTALGQPFLSCGDIIEISVGASIASMGKQNMLLSGKWLVEKIVHYVNQMNYQIKIFATKANTDFSRRKAVL